MKKYFNISFLFRIFGWLFLSVLILYTLFLVSYNVYAPAQVFYDPFSVEYKEDTYIEFKSELPYELVYDDSFQGKKNRIYVKNMIIPLIYFEPYSVELDKNTDFINLYYFDKVLVDENFTYPTIEKNEVVEVWMSLSSSYEIIKDESTVNKIVECAKSDGKIELDKNIVSYIQKYSFDSHCFYLRYVDCPLVEEFHIEETEDGRYIIDQYTPEEYDTIYWEEEAHQ